MIHTRHTLVYIGILCFFLPGLVRAQLPWRQIAEKYTRKLLLSEKAGDVQAYSISNGLVICPMDNQQLISGPEVQRWSNSQWKLITHPAEKNEDGKLLFAVDGLEKGFYRVEFKVRDNEHELILEYYFLVNSDWQKEIMGICQDFKREVEIHPKAHDIGASIVLSHFNNLQEKVALSKILTGDILSRLLLAIECKQQFEQGEVPGFSIGLNKLRFKRFEGAEYADFVLKVPENYIRDKKWPLLVVSDNYRDNTKKGYVGVYGGPENLEMPILYWHSISLNDLQWKNFCFLYHILSTKLNIDQDRIYLFGFCGCGMEAMAMAVYYPDQWAELVFSTGNSYRQLAGNAGNIPITYSSIHWDNPEQTAYVEFARKCFEYHKFPNFQYIDTSEDWSRYLKDKKFTSINCNNPSHIDYRMESSCASKAYWLTILGREDENFVGHIHASVDVQTIVLERTNIDAYQLDLRLAPLDHTLPVTIIDNGMTINIQPQELFTYRSSKYDRAKFTKNQQLHGPINDVFSEAYTVLYTTGNNPLEQKQIRTIAKQIAGTGPCMPEEKLADEIIRNRNIVIVGGWDSCQLLAQISAFMPIQIEGTKISFDGRSVSGHAGIIMIYPNPLNPEKYISLFLAGSSKAIEKIPAVWKNELSNAETDVAIFMVEPDGPYRFVRCEKFNTVWDWHENWSVPLTHTSEEHPKWQWRQWMSHVIRTQMGADVMISEEVFETSEIPGMGVITLRDLSRILKNQWVVKISLSGKELKRMIMQSVTQTNVVSQRKAENVTIDGICFIKSKAGANELHLSDIQEDQYYTVATPYKVVNGSRIGMILKDYTIVGDGYLLQMLYEYLKNRESLQLDDELNKMKLTIL